MSTCIASSTYTRKTKTLTVQFVKGGSYVYHDVPRSIADGLKRAGSQGQFFNANIRNQYG